MVKVTNDEGVMVAPAQRRALRRRKLIVATVMALTFLFLLFYNLGSWFYLRRTGNYLERALEQRMEVTASLTSQLIERSVSSFYDADEMELLRLTLNRIRRENELEAIYLLDDRGGILLDARLELQWMTDRRYLAEDSLAIRTALGGKITASRLHTVAGNHFKSVYAPLGDLYGSRAVLALEANAGFLAIMDEFYRGLMIGVVISLLALMALAIFLGMAMMQFMATESRLYLSERLASLGQMAATVAHEIRNPLAIIKSTAQVLREKALPPEKAGEYYGYIDAEIARLNKMVGDFLDFSREPRLERHDHNLVPLLEATAAHFSRQGPEVQFQAEPGEIHLICDGAQVQQVVLNLLINAQQAISGSERAIVLRLLERRSRSERRVIIEVQDQGPGLQGRGREIFEPFFTTKSRGTGLGLAVCKRIVEAHDGQISALEPAEGGTLIRLIFPQPRE